KYVTASDIKKTYTQSGQVTTDTLPVGLDVSPLSNLRRQVRGPELCALSSPRDARATARSSPPWRLVAVVAAAGRWSIEDLLTASAASPPENLGGKRRGSTKTCPTPRTTAPPVAPPGWLWAAPPSSLAGRLRTLLEAVVLASRPSDSIILRCAGATPDTIERGRSPSNRRD
ncbi:hypothetical protein THAOC_18577, partial [Thalassiosira oceanica]